MQPRRSGTDKPVPGPDPRLITVRHGTATAGELAGLLRTAGVELVVDVRGAPGSRRSPQFGRAALEVRLPVAGISYRRKSGLGGFRRPAAASPKVALRHRSFRAYADYMATECFGQPRRGTRRSTAPDHCGHVRRDAVVALCRYPSRCPEHESGGSWVP